MWFLANKKCKCNEGLNTPGLICEDYKINSEQFIIQIANCFNTPDCVSLEEYIQRLDEYICSVEMTENILTIIQNNPILFSEFIELINNGISCETIIACQNNPTI